MGYPDNRDPRWSFFVLDTTHDPVERSADKLAEWIKEQRGLLADGRFPLSGDWSANSRENPGR